MRFLFHLLPKANDRNFTFILKKQVVLLFLLAFAVTCAWAQPQIYWTDTGSNDIRRADVDGANMEVIVTGENTARGLEIDYASEQFYYVDGQSERIKKANLDGTGVANVVTGLGEPIDLDLDRDNRHVYFTDNQLHKIMRADYDGSNLQDILTGLPNPTGIGLDLINQKIYWADWDLETINRCDLDGSNVETLMCDVRALFELDVCGFKIYYSDRNTLTIRRANMNGACDEELASAGPRGGHLTLDLQAGKIIFMEDHLYAPGANLDRILSYDLDGSNEQVLITGLSDVSSITIDIPRFDPSCVSAPPSGCSITDADADADGVVNTCDVCPLDPDNDIDRDGWCADVDNCPNNFNPEQEDEDGDGIGNLCDLCPQIADPDQTDSDCDGVGDACDQWPGCDDQADFDEDGVPDCVDLDELPQWVCDEDKGKISVCHIPPGNPENRHTICISPKAVAAHLANHGDYIGECDQVSCDDYSPAAIEARKMVENLNAPAPEDFFLYPNPSRGELALDLRHYIGQSVEIAIHDYLGRRVLYFPEQKLTNPLLELDLSDRRLPDGAYLLSVRTGQKRLVKQFIIAR